MKRFLILLLAVCALWACRPSAPLIGISCGRTSAGAASLSANYTEAVARAGGIPVIFPTVSDPALAAALLKQVDGVIFSGGPDLDPSYYGETVWNETVSVDTLRDASDLMLMRAALDSGKPILAICRGEQLMNVVLGGSLYQDIPTQVDTVVKHGGGAWHQIGVEKGSVLYDLFGQDSITVNSSHHQAVKEVAPGVRVTAHSADGIVEAYEYGNQVIAFQFHPEGMARTDDTWLAPFKLFVKKVGRR
ncbi:MAG: gamma-glutamyl-gamma-aminobutyrate hydrolase family protein [Bacteroidales bacterium]|nr:gamma-glutamyl-gamma-aminobutyrate hydrolase family protein [Bacteroidales bacterium]